ncbi:MAG TPA: galactokinase [Solirubrobacteraceae bacterium]|nr:galactokinase [Solirubrobacteraceae bacterium]
MTAFAPGRVNLIGEHTDYNDGLALPFAITAGVTVAAGPPARPDTVTVRASDLHQRDSFSLVDPGRARGWRAFVRGAVAELQRAGHALTATDLTISGDVPRGRGLSSSAALEVSLCLALLGVAGLPIGDRVALARICSRIEREWVGAQTGLLDQLASLQSSEDNALRIDFRTLECRDVPLRLGHHRFVAVDSGEARSLQSSGYNTRREECAEACRLLGIESLRDATVADAASLPAPLNRRVRHVVYENVRVDVAVAALIAGDMDHLGELINASHASLRDDYEISTPAVDATVARLREHGALGARIVGGGFGGSVLALLAPGAPLPNGAIELIPGPPAGLI